MSPQHEADPSDPRIKAVEVHPGLYKALIYATLGAYGVLLLVAIATWNITPIPHLNIGFPIIAIVVAHFCSSWGAVQTDEWAALYFYGRALRQLKSGPYFMPRGLMQIVKVPKGLKQAQAPGEPEEIFHGDDKEPLPIMPNGKQMVRPIRVTTRAPKEGETGHLDVQMTYEWSFYYQYQVLDLFQFIATVGSFEEASRLIRDTGEATLNEFASDMTVNGMIVNLKQINQALDNRIRELVNAWSMQVYEVKALAPNLSHGLATALRNLPIARLEAEQAETAGKGARRRMEEEGAGAAAARAAMLQAEATGREQFLKAEANGLKAKKDALDISGEDILVGEVASDALKHADSLMVGAGDGVRDLLGMVKAGASVLNGKKE